jgi:hypothetical protein
MSFWRKDRAEPFMSHPLSSLKNNTDEKERYRMGATRISQDEGVVASNFRLPLYVVRGDDESERTISFLENEAFSVAIVDVDAEEHLNPRQVPMLFTPRGIFVGYATISRVIFDEMPAES